MAGEKREPVFEVLDGAGRPIGTVVRPRDYPVLGTGMRTILLVRGSPVNFQSR